MGQVVTLYFLPGMMCDERLFSSQITALSRHYTCRVVEFNTGDSIEQYARLVIDSRLQHAGESVADSKSVLVGLSMGGIVAMECLRQAPHLFDALILMDTNPLAEDPSRKRLRPPQIKRALDGELETILIEEMKPLYLAPANRSNETLLALVLNMAKQLGPEVFAKQSKALMNRVDSSDALSAWDKPALVLHGEYDHLCPPERHTLMHALMPQSELHEIPDAGHLPTLEAPTVVNDKLFAFVEALHTTPR